MRIFWGKKLKIASMSETSPPGPCLGALPPDPRIVLQPTVTTLSSSFLVLNSFYPLKKIRIITNCSKFSAFASFLPNFHFKRCSFCWLGAQDYFLSQGPGYLATPLPLVIICVSIVIRFFISSKKFCGKMIAVSCYW